MLNMKKKKRKIFGKTGFSLLEIVVGVSIIAAVIIGVMSASATGLKLMDENTKNIQAAYLLEEGLEAVKILRDSSWQNNIVPLNAGDNYYLKFQQGNWLATSSVVFIDSVFERKFAFSNVNRNASDDIVDSGGVLDPGTKKVVMSVSWATRNGTTTKSIPTYLTNIFNN